MTALTQDNVSQAANATTAAAEKIDNKEYNFQAMRKQFEKERAERAELEKQAQLMAQELDRLKRSQAPDEEDDVAEPYVDHRRLEKKLNRFGESTESKIKNSMEATRHAVKEEIRQELWVENHPDFFEVLQHADKLAQKSPKLADAILRMPDNFDRQKLVYQNIKEFGLEKPEQKQPSMQEKIDANKRGAFYQPTGIGNAPNAMSGDFSKHGQKEAYEKLQQLKARIGAS